jgi:hypothetical protein
MGLVALESEIPARHPDKGAVETAIREALGEVAGSWRAGVLLVPDAPGWVVFVHESERRFKRSAVLDSPGKQRPESVGALVKELTHERRRRWRSGRSA